MIVLIGSKNSKRTDYFIKAAEKLGKSVHIMPWEALSGISEKQKLRGAAIKIDPPSFQTIDILEMREQLKQYREMLCRLQDYSCSCLNTPAAILAALDKRLTKRRLQQKIGTEGQTGTARQKIAVTELLLERVQSSEEFFGCLSACHCYQVFIKPVDFSGAAGVAAFRLQPASGRMQLYTSASIKDGILYNTKQLFCLEDRQEIIEFLDALFQMDVIVEPWYPKDTLEGKPYDLRVVYQFGHVAYIVVRRAGKGPITNLHLNNQAEALDALKLSRDCFGEIEQICEKACALFPGLQAAGVDVMLDKGSRKPRIIEINGQGDLIYQDIYNKNSIYEEQILRMEK